MGVEVTTYLMYGIKTDFVDELDIEEDYLEEVEGASNSRFDLIADFMCGDYMVFGKILGALSRYDGDDFFSLNIEKTIQENKHIIENINIALNKNYTEKDFKILFFNNFH